MRNRIQELAPCGVFCGACPSFGKTCLGCSSENKDQKRVSKWNCKIRNCCYEKKNKNYCINCNDYPCQIYRKKLINSHPTDKKYNYRHELPRIFEKMKEMDIQKYLKYQQERWKCPSCGGRIYFYLYECEKCGKKS